MSPAPPEPPAAAASVVAGSARGLQAAAGSAALYNFVWLALHGVVTRIGWIFKTESVIMPAFLDVIGGSGALRGSLPLLSRVGSSVPAFLGARRLKITPRKSRALGMASLGQAATFGLLAGWVMLGTSTGGTSVTTFLLLYTVFFGFAGLMNVSLGTLTGKLIPVEHRGRLLTVSTVAGVVPAVCLAVWLLPGWLEPPGGEHWAAIFGLTSALFALAALCTVVLREEPDSYQEDPSSVARQLRDALITLRSDASFRTLIAVGVLFTSAIMAFPHYQAFARERLDLAGGNLLLWVVAQNAAMGLASLVVGPLADRYGNRLALRLLCFATALVPAFVLGLAWVDRGTARLLFPLVFVGIGLVPNGMRILANYTLEISPESEHPRYLSLLQLCTAAALLLSPILGGCIDLFGFEGFFLGIAGLGITAGLVSFALIEPRHTVPHVDSPG